MAGSVLLRHAGGSSRRLFSATATSPAVAAGRPLLAGGDGFQGSWVRLMSTSAATQAKDEAAKAAAAGKGDGEKKEVAVNSYWGIEQSQKLVREDGTEWKWSCFKVRTRSLRSLPLLCSVFPCFVSFAGDRRGRQIGVINLLRDRLRCCSRGGRTPRTRRSI